MQIANVIVDLAGDMLNSVPKFGVTPAEVAVLRAIHGESAVHTIEIVGSANVSGSAEIARLRDAYGKREDSDGAKIMSSLFPGIGARAPENFADLNLDASLFAEASGAPAAPTAAPTKTPRKGKIATEQASAADAPDDDGVRDMPDVLG